MVASGLAVLGSTEVKVLEADDDSGCGRPEWKVWISEAKVMVLRINSSSQQLKGPVNGDGDGSELGEKAFEGSQPDIQAD